MTGLLVLALDRDVAGHLALALRRYHSELDRLGLAKPPALVDLETTALSVVRRQEESSRDNVQTVPDDDWHERDFLSRHDVSRCAGVSLKTVDRWIASGELRSCRRGGLRRIARADLDCFLQAA